MILMGYDPYTSVVLNISKYMDTNFLRNGWIDPHRFPSFLSLIDKAHVSQVHIRHVDFCFRRGAAGDVLMPSH